MKKYIPFIVFLLLTAAILSFIFGMSLKSRDDSAEMSGGIVAMLKPIFDPNNKIPEESFHHAVRKLAHFTEFAALGASLWGLFWSAGRLWGGRFVSLPILLVLVCAVGDEFIQYFTGRGSMVTDVVLDFCGGTFGLGVFALALLAFEKVRRGKKR